MYFARWEAWGANVAPKIDRTFHVQTEKSWLGTNGTSVLKSADDGSAGPGVWPGTRVPVTSECDEAEFVLLALDELEEDE